MTYATRAEVLERLKLTGNTSADLDAAVDDALVAATAEIDSDTGRVFAQSAGARTFALPDCWTDILAVPDFRSITALKVDEDDDGVFETTISDFEPDRLIDRDQDGWPFDRVRLLSRTWPRGGRRRRRIEITANWGWEDVPAPINQACSLLASRTAQKPSHALFGVQSFGDTGTQSIQKDRDYWRMIRPYRRPAIG